LEDSDPPARVASDEEVRAAFSALTTSDLVRLLEFAAFKAKSLGRRARHRDGEVLFQDSATAVLEGRRRWPLGRVSFVVFLIGVIRSMASHWAEAYDETEDEQVEAELVIEREDGELDSPLTRAAAPGPDAERTLVLMETVAELEKLFEKDDDVEAILVMRALAEGMSPQEIQAVLDLSRTAYETIITRVRRKARKAFPKGGA
jgi:DNA-directed RNA polymerase specialized sigma24 family protein